MQEPALDTDWLFEAISAYEMQFDLAGLSWSKRGGFRPRSFATLLGIEYYEHHKSINVLVVGDTNAVLLDGTRFVSSFPYLCAGDFLKNPELFSTKPVHNEFFTAQDFFFKAPYYLASQ